MPLENQGNYEHLGKQEKKESQKYDLTLLNDTQRRIEREAREYVMREQTNGKDTTELVQKLNALIERQRGENEALEKQVHIETRENLDKEVMMQEAKTMLYEKLGINNDQNKNNALENFEKGIVDTLILDNYDLAIQVWQTNGKVILDSIKQLASWEGLKKVAEAIGESFWNLLSGNAYERGKSVAELGLVTTGVGAGVYVGKKGFKLGMKEIVRFRKSAERGVESQKVKSVIGDVKSKVNEIVPKQEVNLKNEIRNKLPENVRKLDLELDKYSPRQLEGLKLRLGLDPKATMDDIDLAYRLKLKGTLDRYRELSNVNLARFGSEILEHLKKSGDKNPIQTLENEILRLEVMKDRGELLIVSVIPKKIHDKGAQLNKFSSIDEKGVAELRDRNYLKIRESTEKGIGSYGLDPKYASFLISKGQLDDIKIYGGDNPRFIGYTIDELNGRAGVTLYDSMLSGKMGSIGDTKQMLDYTTETLIKARAIYNIDEKLGFPIHEKLKQSAINANNGQMSKFFNSIKPYVEVHIFGGNSKNVKEALSEIDFINKYFTK